MRVSVRWNLLALVVFAGATFLLYGHAWRQGPTLWIPSESGAERMKNLVVADHQFVVWAVARNAHILVTQPTALFDAQQCFPDVGSLAFGEPVVSMGVLGIPAWLVSGDPILTYNVVLVLMSLLASLAMYWLVASWTGVPAAGIVAGLLYGFSGMAIDDVVHPYTSDTTWMVLALLFAERLFANGRWRDACALAAVGSMQVATSFYPLVASVAISLPIGVWLIVRYRFRHVRVAQCALVVVAVAATTGWILGPYLQMRSGGVLRGEVVQLFSPWSAHAPGGSVFFGWLGWGLALLGLALPRRWSLREAFSDPRIALAVAGLLVAAIATGSLGALAGFVPGLDSVRIPHRIGIGVGLVLSVLVGFGVAGLTRGLPRPWAGWVAIAVSVVAVVVDLPLDTNEAVRVRPAEREIRFHRDLVEHGDLGPIFETPIPRGTDGGFLWPFSARHLLNSAFHHRQTSACYPSHAPPHRAALEEIEEALPAPEAVARLGELGFTTIVVYQDPRNIFGKRRNGLDDLARQGTAIRQLKATPQLAAYRIRPPPSRGDEDRPQRAGQPRP